MFRILDIFISSFIFFFIFKFLDFFKFSTILILRTLKNPYKVEDIVSKIEIWTNRGVDDVLFLKKFERTLVSC